MIATSTLALPRTLLPTAGGESNGREGVRRGGVVREGTEGGKTGGLYIGAFL